MPRKSAAALAVTSPVIRQDRPNAPLELSPEEADVWTAIVEAMPADWFTAPTWPLLSQYCRHVVMARRIAQMIDAASSRPELDVAELKELTSMQARETSAIKAMASACRISQQASYSHKTAHTAKAGARTIKRPWQD